MSSWDLYWVLKLDTIVGAVQVVYILVGVVMVYLVLAYLSNSNMQDDQEKRYRESCRHAMKWLVAPFVLLMLLTGLIPSTKQMAAILIIPKIASPENIEAMSTETKEVYGLFKQWLKDQVKEEGE